MDPKINTNRENGEVESVVANANLNRSIKQKKSYRTLFFILSGLLVFKYFLNAFHTPESLVKLISNYAEPIIIGVGLFYFFFHEE